MAFTPAGMFYLGKEDLAPTQNLIGAGARQAFGMPNQEELVDQILRKADYDTPEGRRTAINEIRKVDPEKAMEFEKMNIEHERSLLLTEKTQHEVIKSKLAPDSAIKGVASTMSNFIISEPLDITYPIIIGTNWTKDGWKKGESERFYKKIKAVEDTFANWLVGLKLTNTDVYKLQRDSDLRREYFERFAEESGTPFIEQIENLFKSATPIKQTGNTLNKTTDYTHFKENKTSTKTKKDEVVTPESMGLNKDDFYFHKGKNMWYYKRGPNIGKPLDKRYQFNMTAADQENEVNSSLFGGTSYA